MIFIERGPANLGGRTRAIIFDSNDVGNPNPKENYNRVFAGAVSGGLWVNENITDPNSSWTLVAGLSSNIAITKIISDPNNPKIPPELIIGTPIGLWRTTDFTQDKPNWKAISNGINRVPVVDLDVLKSNLTILASTHGRGLFTSTFTSPDNPMDDSESNGIKVVPTVSDGNISIVSKKDYGSTGFNLFSITGQLVYKFDIELKKGDKTTTNLQLSSGVYLEIIQTSNHTFTEKIIIK